MVLQPSDLYTYRAVLRRVVDGDTVYLDVDLGGHIHAYWNCRMRGYDAPKRRSPTGAASSAALQDLLAGQLLLARTIKDEDDVYGRYLVEITLPDGRDVGDQMISAGYGLPWDGHGPHPDQPGRE